MPKLKGGKVLDDAARELAMVLDDLEGLDDDAMASKSGDDEDDGDKGCNNSCMNYCNLILLSMILQLE